MNIRDVKVGGWYKSNIEGKRIEVLSIIRISEIRYDLCKVRDVSSNQEYMVERDSIRRKYSML